VSTKQRRLVAVAHVTAAVMGLAFLPENCWSDLHYFWRKSLAIGWHHLPYRDYLWEFPPFTIPLVALSRVLAVNGFATVFAGISAAASYGTWRLLVRLRPDAERTVTVWWFACGIPLFAVAWYRFDAIAAFFACLALVAYAEGRRADGPVIAGFGLRLWPIVLLVVPFVRRRRGDMARCLGLAAVIVSAWYAFSPSGFGDFLRYRKGAGYEVESVFGSIGLVAGRVPEFVSGAWVVRLGLLDHLDQVLTVAWIALVVGSALILRRRGGDPVRLAGALVFALLVTTRIISPQYVVWVLPFVVLAVVDGDRLIGPLFAATSLLTFADLMSYRSLGFTHPVLELILVARNALLIWCTAHELRAALQPKHAFDPGVEGPIVSSTWPTRSSSGVHASTT
jgi:hypothetical protein